MYHQIYEETKNEYYNLKIHEIFDKVLNDREGVYYKHIDEQWILINRNMLQVKYICHRINDESSLESIDKMFGVEVDLKDDYVNKNVMVVHDPFMNGPNFEDYLKKYNHRFIILNVKSERIEFHILELLKKYNINDYFFLDSSFPMIYQLHKHNANVALRYSEYETINTSQNMNDLTNYVWVDCFHGFSLSHTDYQYFKQNNKTICMVSPELQKHNMEMIYQFRDKMINNYMIPSFICCKHDNIIKWI